MRPIPLERIGFSRHSALSAGRSTPTERASSVTTQIVWLLIGTMLIGVAVALLVEANFGLSPYDVLSSGLSLKFGVSLGQAGWGLAAILFIIAAVLKRPPSIWGVAYVFLNGVMIDAASTILRTPTSLTVRLIFVGAGIIIMAAGVNVVVHSGTTGGPFELLMKAGSDRGIEPIRIRYLLDAAVLILGFVLGGSVGFATLVFGATMGLCLVAIGRAVEDYKCGRRIRKAAELDNRNSASPNL